MKTKLITLSVAALLLSGCALFKSTPPTVTVVAPAGPATEKQGAVIDEHLTKLLAATDAASSALSKASASASAISTINGGQPAGPRTDGVANEAKLIQTVAGEPSAADKLAAAERARIVAEGKADEIAKAYAKADSAALQANKELVDTKTALAASNAALAAAKAQAEAEQATLTAKLQAHENQLAADADARVKAAEAKAAADARRLQTWIYSGGGAALVALGIFVMVFASSFPMFGPKAGLSLIGSGLGLIAIGQLLAELERHPWVIWAGVTVAICGLVAAVALIYSNHAHAQDIVKGQVNPLLDEAKLKAEGLLAKAKAEADKLIAEEKAKLGIGSSPAPVPPAAPAVTT
jgi:hypothetical protein